MSRTRVAAGLVLAVLIVYSNAMGGAFHYDDFHSLVNNTSVRDTSLIPSFFTDASHFSADSDKSMYRPLVLLSYSLNYALHGAGILGYQVLNLLLHLGCVLLVWQVVLRVEAGKGRSHVAAWAALLFAIHPIASEPVNYVSSRSETLAAFFLLLAFWLALRSPRQMPGSVLAFCAGLLSKATTATLPFLLLTWPAAKLTDSESGSGSGLASWTHSWRTRVMRLLPYAGALVAYILVLGFGGLLPTSRAEPVRDVLTQLATQWKAVSYYLQLLLMPVHQSVDPAFGEGTWSQIAVWMAAAMALSLLGLILVHSRGRRRWWLLWPVWLALPASAVPLNVLVNEHRIYLASAGLFVSLAVLLHRQRRWQRPAVAGLVILATLPVQRSQVWATEMSLWADAVQQAPHNSRARVHLGTALREAGAMGQARAQFAAAVRIAPHLLPAHTNLANLLYEEANATASVPLLQQASAQYEKILQIEANHREALTGLGNTYLALGETLAAQQSYGQAISSHPDYPDAYDNLAMLRFSLGDYRGADQLLAEVARLEPDNVDALRRQGDARALSGDFPGAVTVYRQACGSPAADVVPCYNLGETLFHLAQSTSAPQSAAHAREAMKVFEDLHRRFGTYRGSNERLNQLRGLTN